VDVPQFLTSSEGSGTFVHITLQRGHLQTSLIAVIIRELSIRERFLPFLAESNDASSKHVFENLVNSFNLSLRLRVKSGAK
jgi:hypothetical protein